MKAFTLLSTMRAGDSASAIIATIRKACGQEKDAPTTQGVATAWARCLRLNENINDMGA